MSFNIVKLTDPIQLTNVVGGLVPKGVYAGGTSYSVGDSVSYNGSSYVCILASTGNLPTNTTYWQVLAEKGDTGATGADSTVPGPAGADGADGLTVSVNSVTQVAGDISLTQDNIPDGTTNKAYTATEQTKLAGIETAADVTDATNVASAGAIMDGDITGNGVMTRTAAGTYTNRTITGTTNQVTVTNGDGVSGNPTLSLPQDIHTGASPTFASPTFTGNLTFSGVTGQNIFQTSGATAQWSSFGNKLYFTNASLGSNGGVNFGINISDASASKTRFIIDRVTNSGAYSTNLFRIQTDTGDATFYGHVSPNTDSTYTLGTSSLYWKETYTDKLFLNSTAYLDGGTAGSVVVVANNAIGMSIGNSVATTYTAMLNMTAGSLPTNGFATMRLGKAISDSNAVEMNYQHKGAGLRTNNFFFGLHSNATIMGFDGYGQVTLAQSSRFDVSSGTQYGVSILPTLNHTGTAGYTALRVNATETATGSGTKLLADFQVGGTSKVSIKNDGVISPVQAATASAPTYVKGGIYFDTTLNKLRIGGATGWETVTSS